jgi:hypothetical protein
VTSEREWLAEQVRVCELEVAATNRVTTVAARAHKAWLLATIAAHKARLVTLDTPPVPPTVPPVEPPTVPPPVTPTGPRPNVYDGHGTQAIVRTQAGGVLADFEVKDAAYPAAPNFEVVGLRCTGETTLRNGLVKNCGMGITSQGSGAKLTAAGVRVEDWGGAPGYMGTGLYGWYLQPWFDLTDCSNGPRKAGMVGAYGLHAYMESGPITFARLTRYRDEHGGDLLIASPALGIDHVELVDLVKPAGKVGLGLYSDGARNQLAVVRGGTIPRISFDGSGWDEIDIAGATIGSLERNGDTIASGQRNWDGCRMVKIDGRTIHQE